MTRWLRLVRREFLEWWRAFLRSVPGELGCGMRRVAYGLTAGPGVRILQHVVIYYPERLRLGKSVGISAGCQLNAGGGIEIGDDVLIGPGCYLWSQGHCFDGEQPIREQGYEQQKVTIGNDVWLGAGVIVLPGVTIADGTVVAAGAVVSRDTEAYSLVAGVPARKIRSRLSDDEVGTSNSVARCHMANGFEHHG